MAHFLENNMDVILTLVLAGLGLCSFLVFCVRSIIGE